MRTEEKRARRSAARRGQAMVELAAGMLALALVVSAITSFAVYIVTSLKVQNSLRSGVRYMNRDVDVGVFAEHWYAGRRKLRMNEKAVMPPTWVEK
ncbi:MAG: hypothetical protein J6T01_02680 [Kiritimatiellae bacterium]|nr:hypothetical protein [Kiritimatiellia bacterium]